MQVILIRNNIFVKRKTKVGLGEKKKGASSLATEKAKS
jgi:hypothetical protein